MKKLVAFLWMVVLVVVMPCVYAESFEIDTSSATTVLLRTGDEPLYFEDEVAITAFTIDFTDPDGRTQTLEISNIEYEVIAENSGGRRTYGIAHCDMEDPAAEYPTQLPVPGDIELIITGSFPVPPMTGIHNSIYNVVLGVFQAGIYPQPLYPNSEISIGFVYELPKWGGFDRIAEVSNVVISNIATGEVIGTIDKIEIGADNIVILEKLDELKGDIQENKELLIEILDDDKGNRPRR